MARANFATLLFRTERKSDAVDQLQDVLTTQETVLGERASITCQVRRRLAGWHLDVGNASRAADLLRRNFDFIESRTPLDAIALIAEAKANTELYETYPQADELAYWRERLRTLEEGGH